MTESVSVQSSDALPLLLRLPAYELLSRDARLPVGYTLDYMPASERSRIGRLLARAFPGAPWDEARLESELSEAAGVERIYTVTHGGEIVASATARRFVDFPESGYVHLVAVDPECRGQRLGEVVTVAVVAFFRATGLKDVVLETGDSNLPALKTYLRVGFVPEYRGKLDPWRWSQALKAILAPAERKQVAE